MDKLIAIAAAAKDRNDEYYVIMRDVHTFLTDMHSQPVELTIQQSVELHHRVEYLLNKVEKEDRDRLSKLERLADNLLIKCLESDSSVSDSAEWHELERALKFKKED